ncbi:putative transmembrane amino acid transporter [Erysiphe necator]|uniref:Putative transmembrane amino acid transporter n=1 Tax=Uncinula necator TaxID=52586 RepID=A0A0B1P3Y7_UNCNE|nr:putative transmembrane amino acid transporter [Erysiphe necator]
MSQQNSKNPEDSFCEASHRGSLTSHNGVSLRWNNPIDPPTESSALLDASGEFVGTYSGERFVRKRSSATFRMNSITQVGGVNSIENFARSWTRAATFIEAAPKETSFVLEDGPNSHKDENYFWERDGLDASSLLGTSTLRSNLDVGSSKNAIQNKRSPSESRKNSNIDVKRLSSLRFRNDSGILSGFKESTSADAAQRCPSALGSYGSSYEVIQSNFRTTSMGNAGRIWRQQQASNNQDFSQNGQNERAPVLLKEVKQDGKMILMISGQSTLPQTIFNSTNVLIGIGILSLPLGFKYAGWIPGILILSLAALITSLTAKLLAKCIDLDPSLITFADIALISYGEKARNLTSLLFTLELVAACVGSIILFADTLNFLIPGVGVLGWKVLCGLIIMPLNFLPLRLLSFTSFIGIFSCICIVLSIIIDGIIKPNSPGSLREPAKTYLFPENWNTIFLSLGLFMSPWGGHSIFPNIYRDMRHPHKYTRAVRITFTFTYFLDLLAAVPGILMFGNGVTNEISANILNTPGYPRFFSVFLSTAIAIIPITKIPLNSSPLISTVESLTGLKASTKCGSDVHPTISPLTKDLLKASTRVALIILFVLISVLFPNFDTIVGFMGSALCTTICVILPLIFYLKLFGNEISMKQKIFYYCLIAISTAVAISGTIAAFLPKSLFAA